VDGGVSRHRDLIHAIVAVDDAGLRRGKKLQRSGEQLRHLGPVCAHELFANAGGIRDRSEHIEDRPHPKFCPRLGGIFHCRMEHGCEEESNALGVHAFSHLFRGS